MSQQRSERLQAYLREITEDVLGFEEVDFEDINQCAPSGENALHRVVWDEGDLKIAKELIDLGIDVNAVPYGDLNRTALHTAVSKGNHDMIELLLDNGANLFAIDDLHGQPPFWQAVLHGREDLVHLIFRRIFGINGDSGIPKIDQSWLEFHERQVIRIRERIEKSEK